jgi:hypothetical protein
MSSRNTPPAQKPPPATDSPANWPSCPSFTDERNRSPSRASPGRHHRFSRRIPITGACQRLSRQFERTVAQLGELQETSTSCKCMSPKEKPTSHPMVASFFHNPKSPRPSAPATAFMAHAPRRAASTIVSTLNISKDLRLGGLVAIDTTVDAARLEARATQLTRARCISTEKS